MQIWYLRCDIVNNEAFARNNSSNYLKSLSLSTLFYLEVFPCPASVIYTRPANAKRKYISRDVKMQNWYAPSNCKIRANPPSGKRGKQTHWVARRYVFARRSWRVKSNRARAINTPLTTFVSKRTQKAGHWNVEKNYNAHGIPAWIPTPPAKRIRSKELGTLGRCCKYN